MCISAEHFGTCIQNVICHGNENTVSKKNHTLCESKLWLSTS